jgi:hypothetical protein
MLLAYVSLMAAPLARLPGILPMGPLAFFRLSYVFILVAALYDLLSRRRVHPAYLWGGPLLVAAAPLRLMLSGTLLWRSFAGWLAG